MMLRGRAPTRGRRLRAALMPVLHAEVRTDGRVLRRMVSVGKEAISLASIGWLWAFTALHVEPHLCHLFLDLVTTLLPVIQGLAVGAAYLHNDLPHALEHASWRGAHDLEVHPLSAAHTDERKESEVGGEIADRSRM